MDSFFLLLFMSPLWMLLSLSSLLHRGDWDIKRWCHLVMWGPGSRAKRQWQAFGYKSTPLPLYSFWNSLGFCVVQGLSVFTRVCVYVWTLRKRRKQILKGFSWSPSSREFSVAVSIGYCLGPWERAVKESWFSSCLYSWLALLWEKSV